MLKNYRKYRFWTYLFSLCLILLMANIFPNAKERLIDQTINDFKGKFQNTSSDDNQFYIFSKPHNDMYITAFNIFLDKIPKIPHIFNLFYP